MGGVGTVGFGGNGRWLKTLILKGDVGVGAVGESTHYISSVVGGVGEVGGWEVVVDVGENTVY